MAAPKTVKTYDLNGTIKDFTIPFEYLARKFVVVTLIGANRQELVLNTDYRFSTPTQITTLRAAAWGVADGYDLIEIRRLTSATERLVDFADGSILRAFDLNTSQVQSLHIAEEARDLTADTIGVNNDGNLDARARRIVNLGDGIDDGDAITMRQTITWAGSALNSANVAKTWRDQAEGFKNTAETHKNAAASSASAAASSATTASTHKDAAAASAAAALASANAGDVSEANALASANAADVSEAAALAAKVAAEAAQAAAETAETNAEGWAAGVNMPSVTGNELKILRANAAGTGPEYAPNKLQTSALDTTSGSILLHGAFGLGAAISLGASPDLNAIVQPGKYYFGSGTATNAPRSAAFQLEVHGTSAYVHQTLRYIYKNEVWERSAKIATPTTASADWNSWTMVQTYESSRCWSAAGGNTDLTVNNSLVILATANTVGYAKILGDNFNASTGRFTSTEAGLYVCHYSITRSANTGSSPRISIVRNGVEVAQNIVYGPTSSPFYTSGGLSQIVSLQPGDWVAAGAMHVNGGAAVQLYNHQFCGYRVG